MKKIERERGGRERRGEKKKRRNGGEGMEMEREKMKKQ